MINRVERFPVRIGDDRVREVRARRRAAGFSWSGLFGALSIGAVIGYLLAFVLPR